MAVIITQKNLFALVIVVSFSVNYISSQDVTPPSISIKEGESASFVCKVGGNGISRIEWYKDKLKVSDRYVVYNNTKDHHISTIQLPAVTVAQGGVYECRTSVKFSTSIRMEGYKAQSAMLFVTGKKKHEFQTFFLLLKVLPEDVSFILWNELLPLQPCKLALQ